MEVCDPQPPPPAAPVVPPPMTIERPSRASLRVPARLPAGQLAVVAGAAVAGDIGLQAGVTNLAAFVSVLLAATAVSGFARNRTASRVLLVAAVVVAVWLPIRASGWLLALNSMTALVLLLGAALAGAPGFAPSNLVELIRRTSAGFLGPVLLARSLVPTRSRPSTVLGPLLRGAAIAALPLLVLGSILANADAVFAGFLRPGFDVWSMVGHGIVAVVLGSGVAGLVCVATKPSTTERAPRRLLGSVEALIVLASVTVLFGLFATSQLVGAFSDIDAVLAEAGLTRSEYAREGFFQLLWVGALTLVLLVGMRGASDPGHGRVALAQRVTGALVSALTVLIVAVAIIRLRLYVDAFGQTTLRWYCVAFAAMLGVVFVLLAVRFALATPLPWFGWASVAVVLATLLFVNIVNPDARVAEHNLARTPLDADYLTGLSADAWPTILDEGNRVVAALPAGRDSYSIDVLAPEDDFWRRCNNADRSSYGIAGFNLARSRLQCD